ncbi:glutaminyl-peptide cyclotransferase [Dyadobacter flavalbus]|nr:glutaminyl-peptide cyclotransferase [Dyadobacter flavalbus]
MDGSRPDLPVASIAEPYHTGNDTVTIRLSKPLEQLRATLEGRNIQLLQTDSTRMLVPLHVDKVGLYPLVISGLDSRKAPISDTLFVEIRSDIKPRRMQYRLLNTFPHAATSFTQGLEFSGDALFEGTGLNGKSGIMRVEPVTGRILQSKDLPDEYFGEGITVINDKIYQLTWKSGKCFRYTLDFEPDKTFSIYTQGWGLTHKDSTLIVSDGSNRLYFYTPEFEPKGDLAVYDDNGPVSKLNELEYVNGFVLANVWETNRIVQINLQSGKVVADLHLDRLVPANLGNPQSDVLNGIAYNKKERALYITGKNWPVLYQLKVSDLLKSNPGGPVL